MRFENSFDVGAPIDAVWDTLLDVERVAPTVPGAQVLERVGDDAYKVAIKVKVGPMSMTYRGEVEITERDEAAHRAVMKARAKESRGQGTADADVTMVLAGRDGGTSATVTTDVQLSGKAATMGQGVLQDVSRRLVDTFAANLSTMLEGGARQRRRGARAAQRAASSRRRARVRARPWLARRRRRRGSTQGSARRRRAAGARRSRVPTRPPLERLSIRRLEVLPTASSRRCSSRAVRSRA
jgi:carbon monoxide dehydrogenase subunit G